MRKIKFYKYELIKSVIKKKPDLIVLGVSSKGIDWATEELKKIAINDELPPLLMLTKGLSINNNNYELLVDKLTRLLLQKGIKNLNISAVGGPCLAAGLANRVQSGVIIASKDINIANEVFEQNYKMFNNNGFEAWVCKLINSGITFL